VDEPYSLYRASSQSLIISINHTQNFMFDCEIKFLLDTKLICKNYDNSEVFCVAVVTKLFITIYIFEN
jgi:hypothetical protein